MDAHTHRKASGRMGLNCRKCSDHQGRKSTNEYTGGSQLTLGCRLLKRGADTGEKRKRRKRRRRRKRREGDRSQKNTLIQTERENRDHAVNAIRSYTLQETPPTKTSYSKRQSTFTGGLFTHFLFFCGFHFGFSPLLSTLVMVNNMHYERRGR